MPTGKQLKNSQNPLDLEAEEQESRGFWSDLWDTVTSTGSWQRREYNYSVLQAQTDLERVNAEQGVRTPYKVGAETTPMRILGIESQFLGDTFLMEPWMFGNSLMETMGAGLQQFRAGFNMGYGGIGLGVMGSVPQSVMPSVVQQPTMSPDVYATTLHAYEVARDPATYGITTAEGMRDANLVRLSAYGFESMLGPMSDAWDVERPGFGALNIRENYATYMNQVAGREQMIADLESQVAGLYAMSQISTDRYGVPTSAQAQALAEIGYTVPDAKMLPLSSDELRNRAVTLEAELYKVRNMSNAQWLEENLSVFNQFALNAVFDPMEGVGRLMDLAKLTKGARISAQAAEMYDVANAPGAIWHAQQMAVPASNLYGAARPSLLGSMNPFGQPASTRATLGTDPWDILGSQLAGASSDPADIRHLIDSFNADPVAAMQYGIDVSGFPNLQRGAVNNRYFLGPGMIANEGIQQTWSVYEAVKDHILDLPSLKVAPGAYNPRAFREEFRDLFKRGANDYYGVNSASAGQTAAMGFIGSLMGRAPADNYVLVNAPTPLLPTPNTLLPTPAPRYDVLSSSAAQYTLEGPLAGPRLGPQIPPDYGISRFRVPTDRFVHPSGEVTYLPSFSFDEMLDRINNTASPFQPNFPMWHEGPLPEPPPGYRGAGDIWGSMDESYANTPPWVETMGGAGLEQNPAAPPLRPPRRYDVGLRGLVPEPDVAPPSLNDPFAMMESRTYDDAPEWAEAGFDTAPDFHGPQLRKYYPDWIGKGFESEAEYNAWRGGIVPFRAPGEADPGGLSRLVSPTDAELEARKWARYNQGLQSALTPTPAAVTAAGNVGGAVVSGAASLLGGNVDSSVMSASISSGILSAMAGMSRVGADLRSAPQHVGGFISGFLNRQRSAQVELMITANPGAWIGNATAANMAAWLDGVSNIGTHTDDIEDTLRYRGVTARAAEAVPSHAAQSRNQSFASVAMGEESGPSVFDGLAYLNDPTNVRRNPLAQASSYLTTMWTGNRDILGWFGFGEANNYNRVFEAKQSQFLQQYGQPAIIRQTDAYIEAGLSPDQARQFTEYMADAMMYDPSGRMSQLRQMRNDERLAMIGLDNAQRNLALAKKDPDYVTFQRAYDEVRDLYDAGVAPTDPRLLAAEQRRADAMLLPGYGRVQAASQSVLQGQMAVGQATRAYSGFAAEVARDAGRGYFTKLGRDMLDSFGINNPVTDFQVQDVFARQTLTAYDDMMSAANRAATDQGRFTMLDASVKNNLVAAAGAWTPFANFAFNSVANLMRRIMTQPNILTQYSNVERSIMRTNQREDATLRDEGTFPVNINGWELRVRNPVDRLLLPVSSLTGNDMYGEEMAEARVAQDWIKYGAAALGRVGLQPSWAQSLMTGLEEDLTIEEISPMAGAISQLARAGYYTVANAMGAGNVGQTLPNSLTPHLGGEMAEYGINRYAREQAQIGTYTLPETRAVMDYLQRLQYGLPPSPDEPANAGQMAGQVMAGYSLQQGISALSSALFGIRVRPVTAGEQSLHAAQVQSGEIMDLYGAAREGQTIVPSGAVWQTRLDLLAANPGLNPGISEITAMSIPGNVSKSGYERAGQANLAVDPDELAPMGLGSMRATEEYVYPRVGKRPMIPDMPIEDVAARHPEALIGTGSPMSMLGRSPFYDLGRDITILPTEPYSLAPQQGIPVQGPSMGPGGDDFEVIEGVGPATQKKLNEAGYTTWAQLGRATLAEIDEIEGISSALAEQIYAGSRPQGAQQYLTSIRGLQSQLLASYHSALAGGSTPLGEGGEAGPPPALTFQEQLELLPRIGPTTASALTAQYGSWSELASANPKVIDETIHGFGPALSEMVVREAKLYMETGTNAATVESAASTDVNYSVYGLVDPRTNRVNYIGQTVQEPIDRFEQHIMRDVPEHGINHPKTAWMRDLFTHGLQPEMHLIMQTETEKEMMDWESLLIGYSVYESGARERYEVGNVDDIMPRSEWEALMTQYNVTMPDLAAIWADIPNREQIGVPDAAGVLRAPMPMTTAADAMGSTPVYEMVPGLNAAQRESLYGAGYLSWDEIIAGGPIESQYRLKKLNEIGPATAQDIYDYALARSLQGLDGVYGVSVSPVDEYMTGMGVGGGDVTSVTRAAVSTQRGRRTGMGAIFAAGGMSPADVMMAGGAMDIGRMGYPDQTTYIPTHGHVGPYSIFGPRPPLMTQPSYQNRLMIPTFGRMGPSRLPNGLPAPRPPFGPDMAPGDEQQRLVDDPMGFIRRVGRPVGHTLSPEFGLARQLNMGQQMQDRRGSGMRAQVGVRSNLYIGGDPTEMTMNEAIHIAGIYGHVPLRISGPPIDATGGGPNNPGEVVTGTWGFPDGKGGIIPISAEMVASANKAGSVTYGGTTYGDAPHSAGSIAVASVMASGPQNAGNASYTGIGARTGGASRTPRSGSAADVVVGETFTNPNWGETVGPWSVVGDPITDTGLTWVFPFEEGDSQDVYQHYGETEVDGLGPYYASKNQGFGHEGIDFMRPEGTDVLAIAEGKVVFVGDGRDDGRPAYGDMVVIEHPNGMRSRYGHLSGFHVEVGDTVTAGQVIGDVGHTPLTSNIGDHLHLSVEDPGSGTGPYDTIDPFRLIGRGPAPAEGALGPAAVPGQSTMAQDALAQRRYTEQIVGGADPNNPYAAEMAAAAARYGLPPGLLEGVARYETIGYDAGITSDAGARGLMQIMPITWRQAQQAIPTLDNPFDPVQSIEASAYYLDWLRDVMPEDRRSNEWIAAAYNMGPTAAKEKADWSAVPEATRIYAQNIAAMVSAPIAPTVSATKWRPDTNKNVGPAGAFNFEVFPGLTAAQEQSLYGAGITSLEALLGRSLEQIDELKEFGKVSGQKVLDYARELQAMGGIVPAVPERLESDKDLGKMPSDTNRNMPGAFNFELFESITPSQERMLHRMGVRSVEQLIGFDAAAMAGWDGFSTSGVASMQREARAFLGQEQPGGLTANFNIDGSQMGGLTAAVRRKETGTATGKVDPNDKNFSQEGYFNFEIYAGIGPAKELALYAAGIHTEADLLASSPAQLDQLEGFGGDLAEKIYLQAQQRAGVAPATASDTESKLDPEDLNVSPEGYFNFEVFRDIGASRERTLYEAGIHTREDLMRMSVAQLDALAGFGPTLAEQLLVDAGAYGAPQKPANKGQPRPRTPVKGIEAPVPVVAAAPPVVAVAPSAVPAAKEIAIRGAAPRAGLRALAEADVQEMVDNSQEEMLEGLARIMKRRKRR